MYNIQSIVHNETIFASTLFTVFSFDFVAFAHTMDDDEIVVEDEVSSALSYLILRNSLSIMTGPKNPLSNQQMDHVCLLLKKYIKKHNFIYSIKQKLSILQEAIEVKSIRPYKKQLKQEY
jgi:hypothetical protein